MIGAVANIILDPIFIFVFGMGVKGAALTTVLSQAFSALFILYILFGNRVPIKITFGGYSLKIFKQVLTLGFAPFLILAFDNILIIVLNMVLQKYGGIENGDMLVTYATIVQSFMLIITMPLGGITGGTHAILGFNYGAKKIDRIKQAQRKFLFFICVLVFPALFGVNAVFYTEPVIDIIAGVISTLMYFLLINRILNKRKTA